MTRTLIGTLCLRKESGICLCLAPTPSAVALEIGCVALMAGGDLGWIGVPALATAGELLGDGSPSLISLHLWLFCLIGLRFFQA